MDSRRAENEDEAERKRQRSVKRPGSHRRSSSLDVRSGINVTGEQGRKSSTHLELPVVTPEQRGRSADGRSGKSRDHLSPGNTSSRRRSSDVRRETSQGRTKYPGVVEDPARNGAHKPKPVVPDQGRAQIESRKNLTRNDLRKAVTSAAEMMGTDPEKSSTAARIILDALLWDSIQKFDRYDDDIVLAKEYLIISYFNTGDFAKAEDLSRQVLAARMAKRPPVAMLVRAARQKLTQVLVKIGTQNRKDGKEQEANQVIDEALDYAVMNVSTRNNPKTRDDAGDVLFCCSELLKHRSNLPKERARLIRFKIMALQKTGNNEGFNSLNRITLERRQLMRTYVLELKDKAQGGKVYDETQRGIEAFQLASRIQSRLATSLSIETEAFWEGLLSDAAKEETDRREVRSRYEGGDTGRSSGDQTTAKGVKHARQKEADLENGNPSDPGVHQGAARTGTGLTDASENEPKFVLFDATPTPTNKLSERWIRNFAKFRRGILPGQFDDKTTERIRLTVIDTGIDASHPFIKEHWNSCRPEANGHKLSLFKDFDSSFDSPVDHDGHGTFIAGLILRLAPDVELSVARVCKNQRSMAEDNCWDEKIARAVYYAGETWKTDIISISLGSFMEATACLRTAIRKVQKSDVVFFCAAGNHGNTRGNLPVPAKLGGVFKIFACDHLGYATTMNPQPTTDKDHCFGILGCDYMSTWPMSLKITGKKPGQDQEMIENPKNELPGLWTVMSGTSFATPVAAALVAIIYQFYNENKSIRFGDVVVDLKTPEAVQAILLRMSLPHGDGYKTLVPTSGNGDFFKHYPSEEISEAVSFGKALRSVLVRDV